MRKATLLCSLGFLTPLLVVISVAIALEPVEPGARSIEREPIVFFASEINSAAAASVPIDTNPKSVLALNVDRDGKLVVSDTEKLETPAQIQRYLKDQYDLHKRDMGEQAVKDMVVVVRGDNRTSFKSIYQVMKAAKEAGFSNIHLQANRPVPSEDSQPAPKTVDPKKR